MNSKKPTKNENGASAVEFAIILPLLLVLLFGIIEFGIIIYDKAVLTNASREAARAGIVSQSPRATEEDIIGIAENYCANYLITFGSLPAPPYVTVTFPPSLTFGNDLKVSTTYSYDFLLVPNFILGLPQTLTLQAVTVMKYE